MKEGRGRERERERERERLLNKRDQDFTIRKNFSISRL
jgi:hypothetical protein